MLIIPKRDKKATLIPKLLAILRLVLSLKSLIYLGISEKRAARIELASLAWKAKVLPLNYARNW